MTEGTFNSYVEVLRQKWKEVPVAIDRLDTTQLLTMPAEELVALWEQTRKNDTTGIGFDIRGWYHALYKDFLADKKIMEVGSGFSIDGMTFAQNGAQVTFVDIVESNLAVLKRLAQALGIQTVQFHYLESLESLAQLKYDYDVIWCMGSLINAPQDVTRDEVQAIVPHLKHGGRWVELGYPEVRWDYEGRMPFERWGEKTDGGAPWMEWKDLKKLQASLAPVEFEPIVDVDFHANQVGIPDFNWFDLIRQEPGSSALATAIAPAMVDSLLKGVFKEFGQLRWDFLQAKADLEHSQAKQATTQHDLATIQRSLDQSQAQVAALQEQLSQAQTGLTRLKDQVEAMQTSKFWRLRSWWLQLKQRVISSNASSK